VFGRVLGLWVVPAIVTSAAFSLSGWFFLYSNNGFSRSYVYLPILFLLVELVLRSRRLLPVFGLAVAIALNVDTIKIADYLQQNQSARTALVTSADNAATDSDFLNSDYKTVRKDLDELSLPIGWNQPVQTPDTSAKRPGNWAWLMTGCGWLLTALAASMGAPFWFDLLNKLVVVRSTVKPHEKSPPEASKDGQTPKPGTAQAASTQSGLAGGGAAAPPPAAPPAPAPVPSARCTASTRSKSGGL
jgi:hypothetical protein